MSSRSREVLHILFICILLPGYVVAFTSIKTMTFSRAEDSIKYKSTQSLRICSIFKCAVLALNQHRSRFLYHFRPSGCLPITERRTKPPEPGQTLTDEHGWALYTNGLSEQEYGPKSRSALKRINSKMTDHEVDRYNCTEETIDSKVKIICEPHHGKGRRKEYDLACCLLGAAVYPRRSQFYTVDLYQHQIQKLISISTSLGFEDTIQYDRTEETFYFIRKKRALHTLFAFTRLFYKYRPVLSIKGLPKFIRMDWKNNICFVVCKEKLLSWRTEYKSMIQNTTAVRYMDFKGTHLLVLEPKARMIYFCIHTTTKTYIKRTPYTEEGLELVHSSQERISCLIVDKEGLYIYFCENSLLKWEIATMKIVMELPPNANFKDHSFGKSLVMVGNLMYAFHGGKRVIQVVIPDTGHVKDVMHLDWVKKKYFWRFQEM